ncbi:F-box/kelch-repeat protein SKIP25 [Linum perenne]
MADSLSPVTRRRHPKRRPENHRMSEHQPSLIPGIPDHLAQLCLSSLPPSLLYSVSHSWRRLLYSPSFPPFLSLYALLSSSDHDGGNSIHFSSFDPLSSTWDSLPPPPPLHPPLRLLLRHPAFISRHLPIQSLSVSGRLLLLAATTDNLFPALSRPLVFDPNSRSWSSGPQLSAPRRWCATGTSNGAVYVASGIGSQFSPDVAKSVEKWNLVESESYSSTPNLGKNLKSLNWKWEKVKGMKDGRFCREAIDAVGWKGKLCMVNVKGNSAAKEGAVYDVRRNSWEEMPAGMIGGWKGPVAAMEEDVMYVVHEAEGEVRRYEPETDRWEEVVASPLLRGAQQVAAGGGKVCVVCGGGIVVVDVMAEPARIWVVELPNGFDAAVAVHILPRMSRPEVAFPLAASSSSCAFMATD